MSTNITKAKLLIREKDFQTLSMLVKSHDSEVAELLENELERASVVLDGELPHDVVTMNSTVQYLDLESKKEGTITLVYPPDVNIEQQKVSILAPVGAALIGLRVGQEISWPMPNGAVRKLKVLSVKTASI